MKELLVLKVGTSTLVHEKDGVEQLDTDSFARIGQQIGEVVASGRGVILVSSGARKRLPGIGWNGVVNAWDGAIRANTQDFLFTDEHLDSLDRWLGAFDVARMGGVAIVNANDPKLPEGSSYHNNDILAATLAGHIRWLLGHHSVQLGMLSDIDGVLADVSDPNYPPR
jgi:glutamate 5-kinase